MIPSVWNSRTGKTTGTENKPVPGMGEIDCKGLKGTFGGDGNILCSSGYTSLYSC